MTEQAGPADGQAEEVVEQVAGLAQGDAQVGAAVAGEQAGAGADVRAGQFQVAAALAGPLTAPAAVEYAAGSDATRSWVRGMSATKWSSNWPVASRSRAPQWAHCCGTDVVFDEDGAGRRLGAKGAGVLAVLLAAAVVSGPLGSGDRLRSVCGAGGCSGVGARPEPAGGAGRRSPPRVRCCVAEVGGVRP